MPWGDDWGFDDPIYDTPDFSQIPAADMPTFETPQDLASYLGDPYGDWGGGQGGDGSNGSMDWTKLLGAIGGKGSSSSGGLGDILKMLGLATGGNGGLNLGSLLGLLAAGAGTYNGIKTTKESTQKLEDAANKSNEYAQAQYNKASAKFDPFIQAGTNALSQLAGGTPTLADKFVSKGAQSDLASKFGRSLASMVKG